MPDQSEMNLSYPASANLDRMKPLMSFGTARRALLSLRSAIAAALNFSMCSRVQALCPDFLHPHPPRPGIALLPTIDSSVSSVSEAAALRGVRIKIDVSPTVSRQVIGNEAALRRLLGFVLVKAIAQCTGEAIVLIVEKDELRGPDVVRFLVVNRNIKRVQYAQERPFYPLSDISDYSAETLGLVPGLAAWRDDTGRVAGDLGVYLNPGTSPTLFFNLRLPPASPNG